MGKKILLLLSIICINISLVMTQESKKTFHEFVVKDINGEDFHFKNLAGKKILVVNTASECGLTPQYEVLEELYKSFKENDFVIIGFPANNFGAQEPGSNKDIAAFCKKNFGVSFPMMSKISVKGEDMHAVYEWLTKKANNGVEDTEVTWNFQKFLIDEDGNYVGTVAPNESPACDEIINWIRG